MDETEIYNVIRAEIITNHVLMHVFGLVTLVILLVGVYVVETRRTVLSVFLPLLTLAWAAATVRFDLFVHRQGAFLRSLETDLIARGAPPLWETWKFSNGATTAFIPVLDVFICVAIVIPTFFILFGPCQTYLEWKEITGGRVYAWIVSIVIVGLLLSLGLVPFAFK